MKIVACVMLCAIECGGSAGLEVVCIVMSQVLEKEHVG